MFFDGMPILDQGHELHNYLAQFRHLGIIWETFHIYAKIHRLPNTSKDYQKSLKHDTKEFSFKMFFHYLWVEEELHLRDKKDEQKDITSKAHIVESGDQKKVL